MNNGKRLGSAFTICLMTAVMINCVSPINAKAIETLSMTPCSATLVGTATIGNEGNGTSTKTATHCDIAQLPDSKELKKKGASWNDMYSGIVFIVRSDLEVSCEWLEKTQTVEDLVNKIKKTIENKDVLYINYYDVKEINDENIKQIAQAILAGKNGQIKHDDTTTIVKDATVTNDIYKTPKEETMINFNAMAFICNCSEGQTVEEIIGIINTLIIQRKVSTINGYSVKEINDGNIKEIAQSILDAPYKDHNHVATTMIIEECTARQETAVSTSTVFEKPKDSFDIYKGQYIQLDLSADMSIDDLVTTIKTIIKGKAVAINGYDTASINDGNIKEIAQNILYGKNGQDKHVATTTIVKDAACTETPTKCSEGSINKDSIKDETKNSIKYETKDTVTPINTIQDATAKPLNQAGSTSTSKTFDGNSILGVLGALTLAGSSLKFVSKKKNK